MAYNELMDVKVLEIEPVEVTDSMVIVPGIFQYNGGAFKLSLKRMLVRAGAEPKFVALGRISLDEWEKLQEPVNKMIAAFRANGGKRPVMQMKKTKKGGK